MRIQDLLTELGKQMNLPGLKLDENRVCRLIFDKVLVVDIEASEDGRTIYIYGKAGEVPPEGKEEFMGTLLEANLFGKGTGGAMFAVDHHRQSVYLCRILATETTQYQDFTNILEAFVNHLEAWMQKIERGDMGSESSSEPNLKDEGSVGEHFIRA
jgi:hypothetical protein